MVQGEPLRPGIYEFESAGPISLSKISGRRTQAENRSFVSKYGATTFRRRIERREGACAVSRSRLRISLIASH